MYFDRDPEIRIIFPTCFYLTLDKKKLPPRVVARVWWSRVCCGKVATAFSWLNDRVVYERRQGRNAHEELGEWNLSQEEELRAESCHNSLGSGSIRRLTSRDCSILDLAAY